MPELLFKPSMRCNAACRYCHASAERYAVDVMPEETVEILFSRIDEYLRESPGQRINFVWHGGEPALLPPSFFARVLEIQQRLCAGTHWRINHSIQSNMTALTEAHLEVLLKLGISHISTSYDPIPGIRGRSAEGGVAWEEYDRAFLDNLHLLERKGFSRAVIYVVHRRSLERPLDLYRFLLNIGGGRVLFNPVDIFGEDPHGLRITPEEYADFLGAILPAWWAERTRYPEVKPFMYHLETIVNRNPRLQCTDGGRCPETHLYVGPDGATSLCCVAADFGLVSFGSVRDRPLADLYRDSARDAILARNQTLPEGDCRGCRFWGLCHGGCPMRAFVQHGEFGRKSDRCACERRFLERYFEPLAGVRYEGCRETNAA
ncbi:MAG: radical SAM protein [Elusimicrobia bacterium]|nr:radical SAM protein [Elusimicrobiota bacterium]